MRPFETFEHTADIGLRIYGEDLPSLFQNAAAGLFSLITNPEDIPAEGAPQEMEIQASDEGELFLSWLREWIFRFETQRDVFKRAEFSECTNSRLAAKVRCGRFDPKVHEQKREVKAVTHHGFKIRKNDQGWTAEMILDI